ncbi:MAG: leucine-rich repeat domain-containing protein, partial [Muribaculaceae bacterium]|nr:leucine-rich repeat domain-containing protein [Muribaculaceae bacterium]
MKRLFLPLMLALLTVAQAWAYTFEVDGIYYNKNGTNATVTFRDNSYNSYSGEVIIPDTVTYDGVAYPVTAIGDNAFYNCADLTAVTIPAAVTTIGSGAFYKCTLLDGVDIPAGVTSIGYQAFYNCSSLEGVTIPAGVPGLNGNQFQGCTGLTWLEWNAVNCPNNGSMPTQNIEQVTIGEGVTVLPDNFLYQSKITEIDIPESVTTIRYRALRECAGLTEVTL